MARGFKVADAYVEVTLDKDGLKDAAREIPGSVGPEMDRSGKTLGQRLGKGLGDESRRQGGDAGGKLAVGMRMSIIRNSPLIVAAVGAALAAGAPVMMAAATGLFAGIGIVAAAQSAKVQAAWLGTWEHIRDDTIKSASAIEPVLVQVAANVGTAFDRMRPQITAAFSAAAPQIAVFANGITDLAENALPGMVRAVEQGMPVTQGLADFLAKIGTGLSDFFDRITAHGPAAGSVFSSLGDIMADLLPILGELLGQGAELAATVLPLLSGSLGIVNSVLQTLGPILPIVAAGFLGFKGALMGLEAAGKVGGFLSALPGKFSDLMSKITPVNAVTGALGITVALLAGAHEQSEQRIQSWTAALNEGGQAAARARAEMAAHDVQVRDATTGILGFASSLTLAAGPLAEAANETDEAREKNAAYLASLTPLETAQRNLGIAEDAVADAIKRHGAGSDEAAAASDRYKAAQAEVERQAGLVEQAIQGVTQAMIDQANQAMAAIDSGFAYENSLNTLEDSQAALNELLTAGKQGTEEFSRAQLQVAEDSYAVAQAYGKQQADLSGLEQGSAAYTRLMQESMLTALQDLRQRAGPDMVGAIDAQIAALQAGGVAVSANTSLVNTLTSQVDGLTGQIHAVPGEKYVRIDAPTEAQVAALQNLGYNVRVLPDRSIQVSVADYASGPLVNIANAINRLPTNKQINVNTNYTVSGSSIRSTVATGGKIGDVTERFAVGGQPGGKLNGPGSWTSDSIGPFNTSRGSAYLSDDEWIIKAAAGAKYGDRLMAAVNAGTATISAPGGGSASGASGGNTYNLALHMHGVDWNRPQDRRRILTEFREGIIDLERSER